MIIYNIMSLDFENLGFINITSEDFKKAEADTNSKLFRNIYKEEKKKLKEYTRDNIDYDLVDVKKICITDDGLCDIEFIDKKINLSYLEWYEEKDWDAGKLWFEKHYSNIPFIHQFSYLLVKNAFKGTCKLDKFEINELKKERRKKEKEDKALELKRNKIIKKLKKEKLSHMKIERGEFTITL